MDHCLTLLLLLSIAATPTYSFSSGAPTAACISLTPDAANTSHGANPQVTDIPYLLNLSALFDQSRGRLAYTPNMTYNSKINHNNNIL